MSGATQFVAFRLADNRFAVPIASIQEIIRHVQPRPTGSRDPAVCGVIDLRGEIVQVRDPRITLGIDMTDAEPNPSRRILVMDVDGRRTGLLVDGVDEVIRIDADLCGGVPEGSGDFVETVATVDDQLIVILDAVRLASDGPTFLAA